MTRARGSGDAEALVRTPGTNCGAGRSPPVQRRMPRPTDVPTTAPTIPAQADWTRTSATTAERVAPSARRRPTSRRRPATAPSIVTVTSTRPTPSTPTIVCLAPAPRRPATTSRSCSAPSETATSTAAGTAATRTYRYRTGATWPGLGCRRATESRKSSGPEPSMRPTTPYRRVPSVSAPTTSGMRRRSGTWSPTMTSSGPAGSRPAVTSTSSGSVGALPTRRSDADCLGAGGGRQGCRMTSHSGVDSRISRGPRTA